LAISGTRSNCNGRFLHDFSHLILQSGTVRLDAKFWRAANRQRRRGEGNQRLCGVHATLVAACVLIPAARHIWTHVKMADYSLTEQTGLTARLWPITNGTQCLVLPWSRTELMLGPEANWHSPFFGALCQQASARRSRYSIFDGINLDRSRGNNDLYGQPASKVDPRSMPTHGRTLRRTAGEGRSMASWARRRPHCSYFRRGAACAAP